MEPRYTLEQVSLLTRLLSIGERLDQTGLPMDSMFQAIYNMEQSYCLGEGRSLFKIQRSTSLASTDRREMGLMSQVSVPQQISEQGFHALFKFTVAKVDFQAYRSLTLAGGAANLLGKKLTLLTRQLAIHQRLQETGLSDASIRNILNTMQQNKTENIDNDELKQLPEREESADEGKEGAEVEVIPNTDTSAEPMAAEEIKIEVDRLMGQRQSHCRCHQHQSE
ncbi:Hypp4483 [Branchiostoma lanceolatum]|uniref:Hypp4483 protein n=1 Tax=Branchiostoma lanceolatum TaxID=7740 RepID=A0A8K0EY85_BRALA|nr:Hypp4483 [Branchiostoma lanceolatum]